MGQQQMTEDLEFEAIQQVYRVLSALDPEAQQRVVNYVCSRLGLGVPSTVSSISSGLGEPDEHREHDRGAAEDAGASGDEMDNQGFPHLAELFDATHPQTEAEKALVAAYWLQVCGEAESVEGFRVNKELKHLGQGLSNVTRAIDVLKTQKPALMMQLRKSGKSKQARKTYKVTHAGQTAVREMMNE